MKSARRRRQLLLVKFCSSELKPHTPQISLSLLYFSYRNITLALWFSCFSNKIICLRLYSRGQTSAGVNGSHFALAEKLLQHSLFFVQQTELLKDVNCTELIAVLGVGLFICCFCSISLCTIFLQFCQRGNYTSWLCIYDLYSLG